MSETALVSVLAVTRSKVLAYLGLVVMREMALVAVLAIASLRKLLADLGLDLVGQGARVCLGASASGHVFFTLFI